MNTFETELQKQTEPYIFCKQHISDYEKTIYILALASASSYSLSKNDIQGLAEFLEVDSELMSKALDKDVCFPYGEAVIKFGDEVIECGSYYKSDFFRVIVNVVFMYRNLNELFDGTDDEEIIENIHIFRAIMHSFDIANAFAATYECMHKNAFSYDYTMFDSAECFRPNDYINMLITLVSSGDCLKYDKGILCTITMLLKYEFFTRANALYLVTVCQILKHSPCFDEETRSIATDLYNKLLFILKNGKVISININTLFLQKDKPIDKRSKKDNTTRLQLLYGYSNYDCYDLRLDFSHKGQEFVHFNNETPRGLSCCIFSSSEYQAIIEKHPELKECFISYEDRWALKEESNCVFSKDTKIIYDEVSKANSHNRVFSKSYSETAINDFISIVAKMLPKNCRKAIYTDGVYSKYCFNYDIIMRDATLLYFAYLSRNQEQEEKIAEYIADKAYRYGLLTEKIKIDSFQKVSEIIKLARDRVI